MPMMARPRSTTSVAAAAGPHTLAIRYAYSTGLFGGVLNRPEGIKVNGPW